MPAVQKARKKHSVCCSDINQYTKVVNPQSEDLPKSSTSERINADIGRFVAKRQNDALANEGDTAKRIAKSIYENA